MLMHVVVLTMCCPYRLYYKHAPKAVKNFEELAKRGYFDGTVVSTGQPAHVKTGPNRFHVM